MDEPRYVERPPSHGASVSPHPVHDPSAGAARSSREQRPRVVVATFGGSGSSTTTVRREAETKERIGTSLGSFGLPASWICRGAPRARTGTEQGSA